jgi:capsular polysaccharide biosynthesis protein
METINRVYFTNSKFISNYYHCFVDFLPIIYVFHKNFNVNEMFFDVATWKMDLIKSLVFHLFDNKLEVNKIPGYLRNRGLITKALDYDLIKYKINDDFIKYIRQFREKKEQKLNKILIKRHSRYISEEIVSFLLNDRGFVEIELEKYSFFDQINLFYNAEYIIGPHGAGLTNMLFADKSTKILELNNGYNPECFKKLSNFCECSFKVIYSDCFDKIENKDIARNCEFNMDLITFEKFL